MKRLLVGLMMFCALGAVGLGQAPPIDGDAIERPFAEGGIVRLSLSSGDYTVLAGDSDRIVVRWTADDEVRVRDLRNLLVDVAVSGTTAKVSTEGSTKHMRFTIEIPARSDLSLRARAGDIRVDGIEGNKDVRMTAGDLTIAVRPASLAHAHATVTFGDIQARALGQSRSGIRRSLDWTGAGSYTLDARLFAGDLTLLHQR